MHGKEEADKAMEAAKSIFVGGGTSENMPTTVLTDRDFENGRIGVLTLLVKCGLAGWNGEARKLVQGGGVSVNGEKVRISGRCSEKVPLNRSALSKRVKKRSIKSRFKRKVCVQNVESP